MTKDCLVQKLNEICYLENTRLKLVPKWKKLEVTRPLGFPQKSLHSKEQHPKLEK